MAAQPSGARSRRDADAALATGRWIELIVMSPRARSVENEAGLAVIVTCGSALPATP